LAAVDTAILIIWLVFWLGWLVSAFSAKPTVRRRWGARPVALLIIVIGDIVINALRPGGPDGLVVHSPPVRAVGAALVVCGLATAVWARVILGRNWGMPMTQKDEPELITAGPYGSIRHPIYSGLILATVGTVLAVSVAWLVVALVMGGYFIYSATVEERYMGEQFPETYAAYKRTSKMLVPFIL
jgi:protein-S-isoprenylcysteine O-methyltransferase Ste14